MKIAVITNSSSYEPRAKMAASFFQTKGYEVTIVESDFIHREKTKGREDRENTIYIDTIPYDRNLSIKRLYSHYKFARDVYKLLDGSKFDLIYVLIPANSLMKYMAFYKKKTRAKLIVDIIDLWPESLPLRHLKGIWPITVWSGMRNKYLREADFVITECELYTKVLQQYLENVNTGVIYWPKEYAHVLPEHSDQEGGNLHLCYLGSINHIIDIKFLIMLLQEVEKYKKVVLHIIGEGEKRRKLLEQLKTAGIQFIYYGPVYDESKKLKVLTQCDYGLNIMKNTVCVGMTMKSVDYMYAGLPMINNIKGDTWDIIEKNKLGYNCEESSLAAVVRTLVENHDQMGEKRQAIHQYYKDMFSKEAYEGFMEKYMNQLLTTC